MLSKPKLDSSPGTRDGHIEVELEQIADGVAVLGPVQAMEGLGSPGIRMSRGGAIQLRFNRGDEAFHRRRVRSRRPERRHRPGPKLAHRFFQHLAMFARRREVHALQREPAGLHPIVVTGDAVAVEHRAGRGIGGRRRRAALHGAEDRRGGRAHGAHRPAAHFRRRGLKTRHDEQRRSPPNSDCVMCSTIFTSSAPFLREHERTLTARRAVATAAASADWRWCREAHDLAKELLLLRIVLLGGVDQLPL